jgi:hypothetical protein
MWFTILLPQLSVSLPSYRPGIIGYLLRADPRRDDLAIVAGAVFAVGLIDLFLRCLRVMNRTRDKLDEEKALVDEPFVAVPRSWLYPPPSRGKSKKR